MKNGSFFEPNMGGTILTFWAPQRTPKSTQNGTQNATKFKTMSKSEQITLQEFLGAVFGRSWGILEAILGTKIAVRY